MLLHWSSFLMHPYAVCRKWRAQVQDMLQAPKRCHRLLLRVLLPTFCWCRQIVVWQPNPNSDGMINQGLQRRSHALCLRILAQWQSLGFQNVKRKCQARRSGLCAQDRETRHSSDKTLRRQKTANEVCKDATTSPRATSSACLRRSLGPWSVLASTAMRTHAEHALRTCRSETKTKLICYGTVAQPTAHAWVRVSVYLPVCPPLCMSNWLLVYPSENET